MARRKRIESVFNSMAFDRPWLQNDLWLVQALTAYQWPIEGTFDQYLIQRSLIGPESFGSLASVFWLKNTKSGYCFLSSKQSSSGTFSWVLRELF